MFVEIIHNNNNNNNDNDDNDDDDNNNLIIDLKGNFFLIIACGNQIEYYASLFLTID